MKKETVLAITFGVLLGLIVAVILIFVLRPTGGDKVAQPEKNTVPKTKTTNLLPLEIKEPADKKISSTDSIKISGTVNKGTLIIIESPISTKVINNKSDSFSLDFPLSLGENVITIRAYADKAQTVPQVKTLKVYYLNKE
ncbi:MAG: hypothetical protein ABH812_03375 [bacterium]